MSAYNYRHVTSDIMSEDMHFSDSAPRAGDPLPRFDLPTAEGVRLRSEDLVGRKPVLLITGSYTCPMTASSNPLLKELDREFGDRVRFVMLQVREAHPGEALDQADSFEAKLRHARELRLRDRLPWPILIDGVDGALHRALDGKPNAAYLADRDGTIVYRSLWAGDVDGLADALDCVAHGERPRADESTRRVLPMARGIGVMHDLTRRAGPRAGRDLTRAAPPVALVARVADLYRPLPPHWRTFAAAATIGAGVGALVYAARAATRRI